MRYSGLTVEEIEDAMISTLKADATLAAYVKTFDRLPWGRADELEKLVKQYPALLVAYAGGTDGPGPYSVTDHGGRFIVCCCAKNLRSPSAALRGPESGEKGVYDLLADVLSCLQFSNLGLNIISCKSMRVAALAASARVAIFSREFEIKWRLMYNP